MDLHYSQPLSLSRILELFRECIYLVDIVLFNCSHLIAGEFAAQLRLQDNAVLPPFLFSHTKFIAPQTMYSVHTCCLHTYLTADFVQYVPQH